jgi:hypothetical protein
MQYHKQGLTLGANYGYKQNITMNNKTIIYDNAYNLIQDKMTDPGNNLFLKLLEQDSPMTVKKLSGVWTSDIKSGKELNPA